MIETIDALFAFAAAAAIAWVLVPVAESLAWRIGAIDRPRERSLHVAPTPKLSGAAILVAVLRLRRDLPALGRADAGDPARRGRDRRGRRGRRPLRPAAAAQAARPDRRGDHPGQAGVTVDVFTLPFVGGVDPGGDEALRAAAASATSTSASSAR